MKYPLNPIGAVSHIHYSFCLIYPIITYLLKISEWTHTASLISRKQNELHYFTFLLSLQTGRWSLAGKNDEEKTIFQRDPLANYNKFL